MIRNVLSRIALSRIALSRIALSRIALSRNALSRNALSAGSASRTAAPDEVDPVGAAAASATGSRSGSGSPARRRLAWLGRRWPVVVAAALFLLTAGDPADATGTVTSMGEVLLLLPLIYLVVAKLRRRGASWPALVVLAGGLTALAAADLVSLPVGAIAVALAVLVWGTAQGRLRRGDTFSVQAVGMLVFGAFALVGLAVDPAVGLYLVAAGWLLHGVWDFVYLRLDRVVSRSYAEWCAVLDILIAAELLLLSVQL